MLDSRLTYRKADMWSKEDHMQKCNQFIRYIVPILLSVGCATKDGARFFDSAMNDHNRVPASLSIPENYDSEKIPLIDQVHVQASADYLFLKAEMESHSGLTSDSIESLKSALVYDSDSATLMQKLAIEYFKRTQLRDATYWAEKAKVKAPQRRDISLLLAGLYTTTKNYKKAEEEYLNLLKIDKNDFEVIMYLGAIYSENKNYSAALQKFKYLSLQTNYSSKHLAFYYLARVYLDEGSSLANQNAKNNLLKSLKMKPDFFESISLYGQILQKEASLDKAYQFYADQQKKIGPNPKLAELLSQYYIEKNKYDLAYNQLEILDNFSDDLVQVKLKMALILIDRKDYDLAIPKLKEILVIAPESDKVRFYLSAVFEEKKEFKKAFDEYMKIVKSSSYFEEARLHASFLIKQLGDSDLAKKVLQESIDNKIENPQSYYLMAQLHEDQKELQKALSILNLAESKFSKNTQLVFYKGTILDKLNLKPQMIEKMKKVLELESDHVQAMNYLAFTWAEMNTELELAEKYARLAVQKEKEDAFILDTLGWVLYKKGEMKEAREILEQAHSMQPTIAIIADHLGDVYAKLERFEKAKLLFTKAIEGETDQTKIKDIQAKLSKTLELIKLRQPSNSDADK